MRFTMSGLRPALSTFLFLLLITGEKKQISNLCCTGLYHFSTIKNFISAYEHYKNLPQENWDAGE
ncbi:hypothetical protein ACSLPB_24510, partial [Escherichia coli]